jgi:hypothetical protein
MLPYGRALGLADLISPVSRIACLYVPGIARRAKLLECPEGSPFFRDIWEATQCLIGRSNGNSMRWRSD